MKPMRKFARTLTLGLVLALAAMVVPDSAVHPTDVSLVKVDTAQGVDGGGPNTIWLLLVGSDARPGENMARTRGDALQLVGVNTRTGAATAIGIPRDSWVPIPGHGYNRVNASLTYGGPSLLGQTVGNLVGVHPRYVMVTRFPYFEKMVNSIGGITVHNPRAFSDPYLKPNGFKKGAIHLRGYDAMAFSRIRKSLAGGDFDRSADQQRTMRGIQRKIHQRADQPGFLQRGVASVMANMATNVGPGELFRLAEVAAHVDPGKITNCVVHGSYATIGGASVVRPYVSQARAYGRDARADAVLRHC